MGNWSGGGKTIQDSVSAREEATIWSYRCRSRVIRGLATIEATEGNSPTRDRRACACGSGICGAMAGLNLGYRSGAGAVETIADPTTNRRTLAREGAGSAAHRDRRAGARTARPQIARLKV